MFSEGNKYRNFCLKSGSKNIGSKVGKKRKVQASSKSHVNKKTRLISNIIHDSNQTNNPHELRPNYSIHESQFVGNNDGSSSSFLGTDKESSMNAIRVDNVLPEVNGENANGGLPSKF
ncbi:unnamed protein product [Meloidogyne enterolobii]|uniref:Uncharacterized protein n=1 Tax=Meloidogyne enterolobii TaxID=390850 RepID=A0ACB1AVF0_MELEN